MGHNIFKQMRLTVRKILRFEDLFGGKSKQRVLLKQTFPGDLFRDPKALRDRGIREKFEFDLRNFCF
jgi:hypothetical protein